MMLTALGSVVGFKVGELTKDFFDPMFNSFSRQLATIPKPVYLAPGKAPMKLEVKKPVQANLGYAGEQINKERLPDGTLLMTNSTLRGGASQAEFLIPRDMRTTYLRPTSSAPKELGR